MFLVLTHYGDRLAQRIYEGLCEKHGVGSTLLLTSDELALSTRWVLRQNGTRVETEMTLADGLRLSSDEITAVFNRLRFATVPNFAESDLADRDYAVMEMHAFLLSWISSLKCLVINRASPRSLGGNMCGPAEWLLLAGRAGLPTRGMRFATSARRFPTPDYEALVPHDGAGLVAESALKPTAKATLGNAPVHFLEPIRDERRRVLVICDEARGDSVPASLRDGCLRLARACACHLIEFTFARSAYGRGWNFCGANPFPLDLENEESEELICQLGSRSPFHRGREG